jgi:hypothetical protein
MGAMQGGMAEAWKCHGCVMGEERDASGSSRALVGACPGVGTGMATSEVVEYGYALRLGSVAEAVVCWATRLRYVGTQDGCTGMMTW